MTYFLIPSSVSTSRYFSFGKATDPCGRTGWPRRYDLLGNKFIVWIHGIQGCFFSMIFFGKDLIGKHMCIYIYRISEHQWFDLVLCIFMGWKEVLSSACLGCPQVARSFPSFSAAKRSGVCLAVVIQNIGGMYWMIQGLVNVLIEDHPTLGIFPLQQILESDVHKKSPKEDMYQPMLLYHECWCPRCWGSLFHDI